MRDLATPCDAFDASDIHPSVSPVPDEAQLEALQREAVLIMARATAADLRRLSASALALREQPALAQATLPVAGALVARTRWYVARLRRFLDERAGASGEAHDDEIHALSESLPFEHALDAVATISGFGLQTTADVAFLLQLELRQAGERLRAVSEGPPSIALIECDSALRCVRTGLAALDASIAAATGRGPAFDHAPVLRESLVIRATYARFRRSLRGRQVPRSDELAPRLFVTLALVNQLADDAPRLALRIQDRLQLAHIADRIQTWLLVRDRDARVGLGLWRDVTAFAELLQGVNRRQELVEHDRGLLERLRDYVALGATLADAPLVAALDALYGLDDDLDRCRLDPPTCARLLPEILAQMSGASAPQPCAAAG